MRKILIVMGIVLLLIAIGIAYFKFNFDHSTEKAIETQGSEITRVSVNVRDVYLSPQTGDGRIRDVIVGNPQGFHTPYAFSFPEITFKVDLPSLTTQLYIIRELHMTAPDINIEQTSSNNNIQMIHANIKAFVDEHLVHTETPMQRFIIESFTVDNAKLHVSAPQIQADLVTIPLPDIDMINIGKEQGGVTSAQLTRIIMEQVNIKIAEAIKSRGLENMIDISELAPHTVTFKDRIRNFLKPLIHAD